MHNMKCLLIVLTVSAISFTTRAATLNLSSRGEFNGHYYELFEFTDAVDGRLNWEGARDYAISLTYNGNSGHLVTLTSLDEDNFVWNLGAKDYFLGAFDTSTQDKSGNWIHENNWKWVTETEEFSFTNWLPKEPNHWQDGSDLTPNQENYLMYWGEIRGWNDTNIDSSFIDGDILKYTTKGFVVEYDPAPAPKAVPAPPSFWLFSAAIIFWVGIRKKSYSLTL